MTPLSSPVRSSGVRRLRGFLALAACAALLSTSARGEDGSPLVSVSFDGKPIPLVSQYFMSSQKIAILSRDGSPIQIEIINNDQKPGELAVMDSSGSPLAIKDVLNGSNQLEIAVPAPGVYYVEYTSSRPLWVIRIPEGVPSVLCLEPGKIIHQSGALGIRYFYVPKGTTEIQLSAESVRPAFVLQVVDPEGTVAATFTEENPVAAVPVQGMDGQVWCLKGNQFGMQSLSFENIPNYLAAAPDGLLLPKDLVQKDGL